MPATTKAKKSLKAAGPPATGPYLGQIETFAFNFAPAGWLPCDGRQLNINGNQALFALLGTAYGGDGRFKFALPNLPPVAPSGPHYFIAVNAPFPPQS